MLPFYRVVVADSRSPRDGRCYWRNRILQTQQQTPTTIKIDALKKAADWIKERCATFWLLQLKRLLNKNSSQLRKVL